MTTPPVKQNNKRSQTGEMPNPLSDVAKAGSTNSNVIATRMADTTIKDRNPKRILFSKTKLVSPRWSKHGQ